MFGVFYNMCFVQCLFMIFQVGMFVVLFFIFGDVDFYFVSGVFLVQ